MTDLLDPHQWRALAYAGAVLTIGLLLLVGLLQLGGGGDA